MNILFIIGNGFDLSCGAKTSYCDVYKEYVKKQSDSEVVRQFKKTIEGNYEKWSDFEIAMGQYAQKLKNESELIECVRDFSSFLHDYLEKINNEYIQKFKIPGLHIELKKEIFKLFDEFYIGITNDIKHEMIRRGIKKPESVSVISFNYTTIFDDIIEDSLFNSSNLYPVTHVHGTLEEGIVMGVDSVEHIFSNYELSEIGEICFVKPKLNESFDQQRVKRAELKIKRANTVCVFGAELGDSDESWREKIINWLEASKNNVLFVFVYESVSPEGMTLDQQIENEHNERRKLMSKWGISSDYFNQVHIQCRKDIFNPRSVIDAKENEMKKDTEEKIKKGKEIVDKQLSENANRPIENGVSE